MMAKSGGNVIPADTPFVTVNNTEAAATALVRILLGLEQADVARQEG